MAVENTLGPTGRAGRVGKPRRCVFIQAGPREVPVSFRQPALVIDRVAQTGPWHVFRVGQEYVLFDGWKLTADLFEQSSILRIGEHHAVLSVVDDKGKLVRKEPWVDRVIDGADSSGAVPHLHVARRARRERCRAITCPHALPRQALRHSQRPTSQQAIIGLVHLTIGIGNNSPASMLDSGMIEHLVAEQRPVLH